MGNCLIAIEVTGSHHNGEPADIDQMAAVFVGLLKAKGYHVSHAALNVGGGYDLQMKGFPLKADEPEFYKRS
jgi:hypothetical protein